jgi:hypothetical protein
VDDHVGVLVEPLLPPWLPGYLRLSPRYERNPRNYLAFLSLAAALCSYTRLVRLTTQDTV